MPQEQPEPRTLTPVQMMWDGSQGIKDFGPRIERVTEEEVLEAEEAMTPAPKVSSALESADSKDSPPLGAQQKSETPALPETTIPTEENSGADKESGKDSDSNADEPPKQSKTQPSPAPSLPSSSSPTSPGGQTPPVPAKPPTSG